ncbi:MAG TPA: lytic transglycosylase domain-containing protein [Beijerinckiaceae bacterium]|jgi:soluble lytic murein transglycosylase-like protein
MIRRVALPALLVLLSSGVHAQDASSEAVQEGVAAAPKPRVKAKPKAARVAVPPKRPTLQTDQTEAPVEQVAVAPTPTLGEQLAAAFAPPQTVPQTVPVEAPAESAVTQVAKGRGLNAVPRAPSASLDALITAHAKANDVPVDLVHRVIIRESRYNPQARGPGGVFGLMQLKHGTARGMGYTGTAAGLLDAETNLTYGVRYLAGAYRTAGGDPNRAIAYFARGYYYEAKRKGLTGPTSRAAAKPATVFSAAGSSAEALPAPQAPALPAGASAFAPVVGGPDPARD